MFRKVRNQVRNHVRNFAIFALAIASLLVAGSAQAAFPERPITLIVPWAAGGGTDAVARQIALMLERDLKQPVNVVNRTGGSGVVGHQAIAAAAIVTPAMPIGNRENERLDDAGRGSNEDRVGRLSVTAMSADDTSALMDSSAGSASCRSTRSRAHFGA